MATERLLEGPVPAGPVRVSVVLPSYQHERFIESAVRSVWSQTERSIELIVVDDASTDASAEILTRLCECSPVRMCVILKATNRGAADSVNRALELARGSWVAFLSSDDEFYPEKTRNELDAVEHAGPAYGCVHGGGLTVDEAGHVLGPLFDATTRPPGRDEAFCAFLENRARIVATTAMVRRDVVDLVGGFDPAIGSDDFDFFLRVARVTKFLFLADPMTRVRVSTSSLGRQPWRWAPSVFAAINKHRDLDGIDWEAVKARRWNALLPNYMEHGNSIQIATALRNASQQAVRSRTVGEFARVASMAAARATLVRLKRRLWAPKGV